MPRFFDTAGPCEDGAAAAVALALQMRPVREAAVFVDGWLAERHEPVPPWLEPLVDDVRTQSR